jgi:tagatose 1,6-diphosphate aldolase
MPVKLSPGKWQRLRSLTDEEGRFKMLAIDQRDSLRRALARATGQEPREVTAADLTKAKGLVTKELAPHATAVLTDPVYGYPLSIGTCHREWGCSWHTKRPAMRRLAPRARDASHT